jgi:hypothetical protein
MSPSACPQVGLTCGAVTETRQAGGRLVTLLRRCRNVADASHVQPTPSRRFEGFKPGITTDCADLGRGRINAVIDTVASGQITVRKVDTCQTLTGTLIP